MGATLALRVLPRLTLLSRDEGQTTVQAVGFRLLEEASVAAMSILAAHEVDSRRTPALTARYDDASSLLEKHMKVDGIVELMKRRRGVTEEVTEET